MYVPGVIGTYSYGGRAHRYSVYSWFVPDTLPVHGSATTAYCPVSVR